MTEKKRPLIVYDLECGMKGWSQAFEDRGHKVVSVDIDKKFKPTVAVDINELDGIVMVRIHGRPDVVLASPPCNKFSVASLYHNWEKTTGLPKNDQTREAIRLVGNTIKVIMELQPKYWFLENPRGMMRRVLGPPATTVTYCQYGERIMKPTDLWGVFPKAFKPLSCKNGDPCHERARRSSQKGTQGIVKNKFYNKYRAAEIRAKVPYGLSKAVCIACEEAIYA